MKQIDYYTYNVDFDGTLIIFGHKGDKEYLIAELQDCISMDENADRSDKAIRSLIDDVLADLGYEVKENETK